MLLKNIDKSLDSLKLAIGGNENISAQESENNIADNLVVVAGFDNMEGFSQLDKRIEAKAIGAGTGLQITKDGFILTAYHNISEYVDDWKKIMKEYPPTKENFREWLKKTAARYSVIDKGTNVRAIDISFSAFNKKYDIALIKAMTLESPEPVDFRVVGNDLKEGDMVQLFGLRNQRQYNQIGRVISDSVSKVPIVPRSKARKKIYDTILTDAYGVSGFSGETIATLEGEVGGMGLYIDDEKNASHFYTDKERKPYRFPYSEKENKSGFIGKVGGAKYSNIKKLVDYSCLKLKGLKEKTCPLFLEME